MKPTAHLVGTVTTPTTCRGVVTHFGLTITGSFGTCELHCEAWDELGKRVFSTLRLGEQIEVMAEPYLSRWTSNGVARTEVRFKVTEWTSVGAEESVDDMLRAL